MLLWVCIVVAVVVGWVYTAWKERKACALPGPFLYPFVGVAPRVLRNVADNTQFDYIIELYEKYGNTFYYKLFDKRVVFISETEDLKHFFQTNFSNYVKGEVTNEVLYDIFGDGIFNTDGERWRVQRQTASSLFHFNNLHDFVQVFKERAADVSSVLSNTSTIDMQQVFMRYTLDSIGELGFGVKMSSLGTERVLKFSQAFDYVQAKSLTRFFFHPYWKYFPQKEFKKNLDVVDKFMDDIIESRKQEIASGVDISGRVDLLSRFISVKNEDGTPTFDKKYLLDVLKNFLIAGRDTTAVCLTWTLYALSQHPDVEQKLLKEIEEIVGKDSNGITYENLAQLTYMKQVIDESLRLYPPIPGDNRMAVNDDLLPSGHLVPAGSVVSYIPYAQHRMAQYFKDPLTFNPDRWATDQIKGFSFVPFHGGPRVCLGQNMAYQEVKVALCEFLPKFSFQVVKGHVITHSFSLSLPMKYGLRMHVEKRKK